MKVPAHGDHFIILGEAHLCRILRTYTRYYNVIRTHRSLDKDAPNAFAIQGACVSVTYSSGFCVRALI